MSQARMNLSGPRWVLSEYGATHAFFVLQNFRTPLIFGTLVDAVLEKFVFAE
jgi:hypothetical protein